MNRSVRSQRRNYEQALSVRAVLWLANRVILPDGPDAADLRGAYIEKAESMGSGLRFAASCFPSLLLASAVFVVHGTLERINRSASR